MKRTRYGLLSLAFIVIVASAAFLVFRTVRQSVASEGYDTNEAAWNYLIRRGEIRFQLADGCVIKGIQTGNTQGTIANSNEAYLRLGYGAFTTTIEYADASGAPQLITIRTDKFNNWNRVLYVQDNHGNFTRIDNGVVQDPDSINIKQGEQVGARQPATRSESKSE
ncbi:hypothetical protein [Sulfuriroseicoccus oceanibius]|uniref:Uncharacterized protein n=1 Tax=Sulfuriroseicoccus oceanibius TaxID=2707525 RepID=A0A6B3L9R7_9BACT|nr:hypothetical protein [Sulfuriroseicoccus oceanibius]QQL44085.1 hypothetical protein G3M56_009280 [Sulfuriroseicoccus oceanibius]